MKVTLPADTTNVSGANAVLYDASGNVLAQWSNQSIADNSVSFVKGGLLVNSGKLVVTWLDLSGNALNDQTVDVTFSPES